MRLLMLLTTATFLCVAAPLAAQLPDPDAPAGKEPFLRRIQAQLGVSGTWLENFGQAPADGEPINLTGTVSDLALGLPVGRGGVRLLVQAGGTFYEGFDPGKRIGGGIRWTGDGQALEAAVSSEWGVPRVEVGDELGIADVLNGRLSWATRPWAAIQLSAQTDVHMERYPANPERRSQVYEAGAALRYRGFGSAFSPELGVAYSGRSVLQQAEDYGQRSAWLSLRTAPSRWFYLHVRYRNRLRMYGTEDPTARNFERRDTRHQVTLSSDVALGRGLSWTTYYAQEAATSTVPSRTFDTRYVSSGLVVRVN